MSSSPRDIGTLIVVVLKANHLPNKRHIGKQAPYCVLTLNGEKRRTKAIHRGGQHPEWDEEIRFQLKDAPEVERTNSTNDTPPPPPPKNGKVKNIEGGNVMKVACYADDPREPDLIGETDVDLTEVLTKGECDEWFTLNHKDKFAGKVYLELTFWSNEPPPEKKPASKVPKSDTQYAGPGTFVPSGGTPQGGFRVASTSILNEDTFRSSTSIPSSLRTSSSLAQLDLYSPPYERERHASTVESIVGDFREMGFAAEPRRRESLPPTQNYSHRHVSSSGFTTVTSIPATHGYDQQTVEESLSHFRYDSTDGSGFSLNHEADMTSSHYPPSVSYQPQYEPQDNTGLPFPTRSSRYSIPASSSGFVPLRNSSGFAPLPSHTSEPSGFSTAPTPAPVGYNAPPYDLPSGIPAPTQTPIPLFNSATPVPSSSFHQHVQFPQSSSFQAPFQPQNISTHSYTLPSHLHDSPSQAQQYGVQVSGNLVHEGALSPVRSTSLPPSGMGTGSRPLPQPQGQPGYTLPGSYSPSRTPYPPMSTYQVPLVPPPPPLQGGNNVLQPYPSEISEPVHDPGLVPPPPPPPPPTLHYESTGPRRQNSLPPPPTQQPIPPPPLPPLTNHNYGEQQEGPIPATLFHHSNQPFYPGPPPKPPALLDSQMHCNSSITESYHSQQQRDWA